jgi:uncharacterized protein (DUF58 family)
MIVPSERLVWLAVVVALPAATAGGIAPALAFPCALVVTVLAAAAVADAVLASRRASDLQARAPEVVRLTKDVAGVVPVTIENRSAAEVRVRAAIVMPAGMSSGQQTVDVAAPPGESRLEWPATGAARGDHSLRAVHLETTSPMGLWLARVSRPLGCTFRVYPNLHDHATAALFLRTADAGLRRRPRLGKGKEFDNLRQYITGDSYEDIHWKATARRGFPVVKLFQVEHAQEVYTVIDSSRLAAREGILESYINAALHLALVAQRQGDRFGLVTFSGRTHRFVGARSGLDHFRLCRETIYDLRAERVSPDFREVFTNLQVNLRRRALLVFFTSLDDAMLAESFAREIPLVARRHLVLVNAAGTRDLKPLYRDATPDTLDQLYQGLAGQVVWNRMRELQLALQNKGVKLTMVDPERIKLQVTGQYLEVKRRQAL